jgi:sulfide:quinone oxidoreductase
VPPADAGRPKVLIAGGGVAALEAALALEETAARPLDLALLAPDTRFEYSPLSVAEPFGLGRAHRFELAELLRGRDVEMVAGALEAVDPERREARTVAGRALGYDALLVAVGARRRPALPGALTFEGPRSTDDVRRLLRDAEGGRIRRLAVAVPRNAGWALPAYEMALMAAAHFQERGLAIEVTLATPEPRPLEPLGPSARGAVEEMLRLRHVAFRSAVPVAAEPGRLLLEAGEPLAADAVIALPRLDPPRISGLPRDERGFVPVDRHGRVAGLTGVYAAGDMTSFPLKQGGLAAQQADAAAEAILADLGQGSNPEPFQPVLRGLLLAGRAPRYMRAETVRGRGEPSSFDRGSIRWAPAKVAGRRLGPLLAIHGASGGPPPDAVAIELDEPLEN